MAEKFPYTLETPTEEENKLIKKEFAGYLSGAVRVRPSGYFFQGIYRDYAERLFNFSVKSSDVFVVSYPKCGTTWTQEMTWLLLHDLDYEGAKVELDSRFPFLEADHVLDPEVFKLPVISDKLACPPPEPGKYLAAADNFPSPRTIKTHMPFSLLPPKLVDTCKVIYVTRDPRDVVVSYYHHHRMWATHGYSGDFKKFFDFFINEQVMWSPFWSHVREAWEKRHHSNLLIVTYEQLKADLPSVIKKVANFLGKNVTPEDIEKLSSHLHIDTMKNNMAVNCLHEAEFGLLDTKEGGFIRQGKSGGWRSYFDAEMIEKFDKWTKEKGQGLEKEFNWV
ncbi:luciferin sulfotransferase-like [Palaemon carinicauda]|uniref:luciferin sulfotransferase-like n=1 Tax=Palaemon carinicauda TaxID=392227 RepID=UPI0035B609CC